MSIDINYTQGRMCVAFDGDLDHHNAKTAMDAIREGIDTNLPAILELDLKAVGFADSSAFAILVRAKKLMDEIGGKMEVLNVQSQPMKLLNAAKIGKLLEVTLLKENK